MLGRRLLFSFALAAAATMPLVVGCSPSIGDACGTSTDCDVNGTRICDLTQPDGYCTIRGCDVGTCPDGEASCVQFNADEPRRTDSFCMYSCESDSDCRDDRGYRCITAAEVAGMGMVLVIDGAPTFCAIPPAATP